MTPSRWPSCGQLPSIGTVGSLGSLAEATGKLFVPTGTFPGLSKDELCAALERRGAKFSQLADVKRAAFLVQGKAARGQREAHRGAALRHPRLGGLPGGLGLAAAPAPCAAAAPSPRRRPLDRQTLRGLLGQETPVFGLDLACGHWRSRASRDAVVELRPRKRSSLLSPRIMLPYSETHAQPNLVDARTQSQSTRYPDKQTP